jgi:cell division septum initiation protein DivIVA
MIAETVTNVLARIQDDLNSQAEALLSEIGQTRTQVEEISADIDTQWQQVESRAQSVISRAQEAESQLDQLGEDHTSVADALRTHITNALDQGKSVYDNARAMVESLDQGVQSLIPDADEVAAMVEGTIQTLSDEAQNLQSGLESVRSFTDEHLHNAFKATCDTVQSEIFSRAEQIGSYVSDDLLPTVANEVEELTSFVDQTVQEASTKAEEMRANAESEGSEALDMLNNMFGEQFGGLIETGQTIANLMQQIGGALTNTTEIVGTTTKAMSSGVNLTGIGAKSVINIIENIIEIFNGVM